MEPQQGRNHEEEQMAIKVTTGIKAGGTKKKKAPGHKKKV